MNEGQGSSAFLTDITSGGTSIIGLKFSNVVVDSINTATGIAQMHFTPLNNKNEMLARDQPGGAIAWQMKMDAVTGNWLMNGNQRIASVSVRTTAGMHTCNPANNACTMATKYTTGLSFYINNKGQQAIGSAVVTGTGLPVGGVTLTVQLNQTWFNITTTNANNTCVGGCGNNWNMADSEIALVLPNSVYTVKLYSNATTPVLLATYTEVVPVAPVLNTAIAVLAYPSITGMVNLAGVGATTLTPSWAIPVGLYGDWLSVYVWQSGTNLSIGAELNATSASSGTSTIVITAPATGTWSNGNYWISAWDQYGGKVSTDYQ